MRNLLRTLLILLAVGPRVLFAQPSAPIPVVLSTDVGNEIDDQWAIVYLLSNQAFDVKGILSAHAPSIRPPAARTSYLVLRDIVERRLNMSTHPPLLEGANEPLMNARMPAKSAAFPPLIKSGPRFHRARWFSFSSRMDPYASSYQER